MSLITPDIGLIFWMTLIFGIVFFILAKFGFPMITKMVDERSTRIEESIAKAKEAEQKLSQVTSEQEEIVRQARLEQGRILKEAAQTRDQIVEQAKAQAREEADKLLEHAKLEIAAERESAIREIRSKVALISVEVAEKVVRKEIEGKDDQLSLIDRYVQEVSDQKMN